MGGDRYVREEYISLHRDLSEELNPQVKISRIDNTTDEDPYWIHNSHSSGDLCVTLYTLHTLRKFHKETVKHLLETISDPAHVSATQREQSDTELTVSNIDGVNGINIHREFGDTASGLTNIIREEAKDVVHMDSYRKKNCEFCGRIVQGTPKHHNQNYPPVHIFPHNKAGNSYRMSFHETCYIEFISMIYKGLKLASDDTAVHFL